MKALEKGVDTETGGADLRQVLLDFAGGARGFREMVRPENREKVDGILARFDRSMGEIEKFSKDISLVSSKLDNGESTIGRLLTDDSTIEKIEGAVEDVRKLLSPAVDLETIVDAHGEISSSSQAFHYFNLQLRTRLINTTFLGLSMLLSEPLKPLQRKSLLQPRIFLQMR